MLLLFFKIDCLFIFPIWLLRLLLPLLLYLLLSENLPFDVDSRDRFITVDDDIDDNGTIDDDGAIADFFMFIFMVLLLIPLDGSLFILLVGRV